MMIRLLRGAVAARGRDYLVVEVGQTGGGVGFKVHTPEPTAARFIEGAAVFLHTHLQVREDSLTLFGFESEDELAIFDLLLSVSGVGPKAALSILSTLSPDALRLALANQEPGLVARAPGVGKRTAEKIILELKDKLKGPSGNLEALAQMTNTDAEVIDALVALGYSIVEAQRAIQKLPREAVSVEDRLRLALSQFGS